MDPLFSVEPTLGELARFFGPKLLLALFCGGLIGLEREIKQKSAGLKTNMLICAGAALYTSLSVVISTAFSDSGYFGDPARVAAQIVSGIGFLGAGAIIQSRGAVTGLTTAATIWVVAAIGVAVGLGYYEVGVGSAVLVVLVLTAITVLEKSFLGNGLRFACDITVDDPQGSVRRAVNEILVNHDLILDDFDISTRGKAQVLRLKYRGAQISHKKFILSLWGLQGVKEVKQK